jgi:hypothetical protein
MALLVINQSRFFYFLYSASADYIPELEPFFDLPRRWFYQCLKQAKAPRTTKAYQPSCSAPVFQPDGFPLFPQTGQFPPLNPDNNVWSYKKFFQ